MREELRRNGRKSGWHHNRIYEDVAVALESGGMMPSTFWMLDISDRAFVIAYHRVKGTISEYDDFLREKASEAQRRRNRPGNR